jgi:hypothetical protein
VSLRIEKSKEGACFHYVRIRVLLYKFNRRPSCREIVKTSFLKNKKTDEEVHDIVDVSIGNAPNYEGTRTFEG